MQCDMKRDCAAQVTHIGEKGWLYCAEHAPDRRGYERVRKLRPWEIRWLAAGKRLPSYTPLPMPREVSA